MKLSILKFSLVLVSLAISVLVVEAAFRIYGYAKHIDFRLYEIELRNSNRLPEGILGYPINKPSGMALATTSDFSVLYTINSHGLRDQEYDYRKPAGTRRITVFGDSFTFGEGIPDGKRFTDILEKDIPGIQVLNFGIPGAALDHMALLAVNEGLKYDPDHIVLVLNNLVTDRGKASLSGEFEGTGSSSLITNPEYTVPVSDTTSYLKRDDLLFDYHPGFLIKHSYALAYLQYRLSIMRLSDMMKIQDETSWKNISGWHRSKDGPDFLKDTDIKQRTVNILNRLHEFTSARGIKLVAINIDTEPLAHFYQIAPPFPYIDMSAGLKEESKKYRLTFTYDQHYNQKTNAFIAGQLEEYFRGILGKK